MNDVGADCSDADSGWSLRARYPPDSSSFPASSSPRSPGKNHEERQHQVVSDLQQIHLGQQQFTVQQFRVQPPSQHRLLQGGTNESCHTHSVSTSNDVHHDGFFGTDLGWFSSSAAPSYLEALTSYSTSSSSKEHQVQKQKQQQQLSSPPQQQQQQHKLLQHPLQQQSSRHPASAASSSSSSSSSSSFSSERLPSKDPGLSVLTPPPAFPVPEGRSQSEVKTTTTTTSVADRFPSAVNSGLQLGLFRTEVAAEAVAYSFLASRKNEKNNSNSSTTNNGTATSCNSVNHLHAEIAPRWCHNNSSNSGGNSSSSSSLSDGRHQHQSFEPHGTMWLDDATQDLGVAGSRGTSPSPSSTMVASVEGQPEFFKQQQQQQQHYHTYRRAVPPPTARVPPSLKSAPQPPTANTPPLVLHPFLGRAESESQGSHGNSNYSQLFPQQNLRWLEDRHEYPQNAFGAKYGAAPFPRMWPYLSSHPPSAAVVVDDDLRESVVLSGRRSFLNTGRSECMYLGPQIVDVWAYNLEEEFAKIRDIVERYQYVAIVRSRFTPVPVDMLLLCAPVRFHVQDTEFPGVVAMPTGACSEYHYKTIKYNVDLLKVIQLGITFADERGCTPLGTSTWQFNFKFDLSRDMYAEDSINFLRESGIDFETHQNKGIDIHEFGEIIMSSGLVMSKDVKWISFHGSYDFGYLLKLLTCAPLPDSESQFFELLRDFFPALYDIKYLLKNCPDLSSGASLQKVAEHFDVQRIGRQHQAGSDSLVTCHTFFRLMDTYFDNLLDDSVFSGVIYGLGGSTALEQPPRYFHSGQRRLLLASRGDRQSPDFNKPGCYRAYTNGVCATAAHGG